jgi:hypothetical protein
MKLRGLRTFPQLVAFLRDELDWPVESDDFEELTFDWSPEELGIPHEHAARIEGIRQLRSLSSGQPWGVFFVKFQPARLPVASLRRVLRALVPRRRTASNAPDRPSWLTENLLFISAYGEEEKRGISFVHFNQPPGSTMLARLASFGWDTSSHNRTVVEHNLPHLRWPGDPKDPNAWCAGWQRAFDKEKLTKEFFARFTAIYETVRKEIAAKPALRNEADARALTLLSRILFLCFIQKKGWLAARPDYLYEHFEPFRAEPGKTSYYRDHLWPLFEALSTPESGRQGPAAALKGIPFLNGGLFSVLDDPREAELPVRNETFERLFSDILQRYNFTVTEDTPLDVEVAIDPEMLGKIFEEVVTGRHEKGAYYTPRPIVAFMCREALKGHLGGGEAVGAFVDRDDASGIANPEAVLARLRDIRVCDPACGSGAYPKFRSLGKSEIVWGSFSGVECWFV